MRVLGKILPEDLLAFLETTLLEQKRTKGMANRNDPRLGLLVDEHFRQRVCFTKVLKGLVKLALAVADLAEGKLACDGHQRPHSVVEEQTTLGNQVASLFKLETLSFRLFGTLERSQGDRSNSSFRSHTLTSKASIKPNLCIGRRRGDSTVVMTHFAERVLIDRNRFDLHVLRGPKGEMRHDMAPQIDSSSLWRLLDACDDGRKRSLSVYVFSASLGRKRVCLPEWRVKCEFLYDDSAR